MFHTNVAEKIKTHILCSIFLSANRAVYEIKWKTSGQLIDNVAHAKCMIDT